MSEISRALARHDPETAYTLLREFLPVGWAGRALQALIQTQPSWPQADREGDVSYDQRLSRRELEVLRCAERGLGVVATARELILGAETIKRHRTHIMVKFGARSMLEAIHTGRELGLL